jgi:AcrR family transcriptional regulator
MRSLPGRAERTSLAVPAPELTRDTVSEEQRRRIRRAVGELVAKRGFGEVTVELIIKRARVSFKTFYKHYANKEEAFADLFDRALAVTVSNVMEAIADPELPWPEQVALAIRTYFESVLAEPLVSRACIVEGPTAGPEIVDQYERVAKAFVPILRQGRKFNPEAEALPESLEETLAGAVLWSAYQRLGFGETDRITELIPENVELVLRPYIGNAEASRIAGEAMAQLSQAN